MKNKNVREYLNALRENAESRRIPIISRETEGVLQSHVQKFRPQLIVEIGSAIGYSTLFLASVIQEWGGQIISFEVAYQAYLEALIHIKRTEMPNITVYPHNILTTQVGKFVPKKADMLFVDGQKAEYGNYLEKLREIKGENTTIILDDVIKYHNKLESLYGFLGRMQISFEIVKTEPGDGVMIIS